jgi:cation:H+ antiporter
MDTLFVVAGLIALALGGELLIRGALAAARRLGVSPLMAGLVIVGFGTSAPELVVSLDATFAGRPAIAIGNVVGSNIGNVLLILGTCAVITPLGVNARALRRDGTMMGSATVLFILLAAGGFSRGDGLVLFAALLGYLGWAYWSERYRGAPAAKVHQAEADELSALPRGVGTTALSLVGGLLLLVGGSRFLVIGAVSAARELGVPDTVIGVTLVAVGTSLPEFAVSLMAALRRHADVAVGNILGSNIFNILGILGLAALLHPLPADERILRFDQWVMLAAAAALLGFLYTGLRLVRWEGAVLIGVYIAYIVVGFATAVAP